MARLLVLHVFVMLSALCAASSAATNITFSIFSLLNLDTQVIIVDATCDNTPDGSITLIPKAGTPPYTYAWSIPGSLPTQSGLLPGTYFATVTDNVGITEMLEIVVGTNPGTPLAQATTLDGCSMNAQEEFDLTTVESIVNMGTGFDVLWYENADLTNPILFPTTYFTGGATVYAVVDNGTCQSAPVPVVLTLYPIPIGIETSISLCDDDTDGYMFFDLTPLEIIISGGTGTVTWFYSNNQTNQIIDPSNALSHTQLIFAHVFDGHCLSPATPIFTQVLQYPAEIPLDTQLCGDPAGMIQLDLTTFDQTVSNGMGTVTWFTDASALNPIPNPTAFTTGSVTVYAIITNVICSSNPVPVSIDVVPGPTATSQTLSACNDGMGMATFNLTDAASLVSNGSGNVTWYSDASLMNLISNPAAYFTAPGTVYAVVGTGICTTPPVAVQLNVVNQPIGIPSILTTCDDGTGNGIFDLIESESIIYNGPGTVTWFIDGFGLFPVPNPAAHYSMPGTVYALISEGNCSSIFITITLTLSGQVVAMPSQMSQCDEGTGSATFDLTLIENNINGGNGTVAWFIDAAGNVPIANPVAFFSGTQTIYARVIDGTCISALVPIQLTVNSSPVANSIAIDVCGDSNGQAIVDLTSYDVDISANTGTVTWYTDASLSTLITNPSSYLTGPNIVYAVVANALCTAPAAQFVIAIVGAPVVNPVSVIGCIIDQDTSLIDLTSYDLLISGGTGNVLWFTDANGTMPIPNTTMFDPNGSSVYAMVVSGTCSSAIQIINIDWLIASTPSLECAYTDADSISISWTAVASSYSLSWSINNLPQQSNVVVTDTFFSLGNLAPGDEVMLIVAGLFNTPCTTLLTESILCSAVACPPAIVEITHPGVLCTSGAPEVLDVMISGLGSTPTINWSGDAISVNDVFDPAVAGEGLHIIYVSVEEGQCSYGDSIHIQTILTPEASFFVSGAPCVDSTLELYFNGYAVNSAQWHYNFGGAVVTPLGVQNDYILHWDSAGEYALSLYIDYQGCESDTFKLPIIIGETPGEINAQCETTDLNSVLVSWETVPGATDYTAMSSEGTGQLAGTSYLVTGLEDNSTVSILISATGDGSCGISTTTLVCQTQELIEAEQYLPNIFSPNGDGINDIFFVQANSAIAEITEIRIYDRWGNLVFEKLQHLPNDPTIGWDGSYRGKTVNPGVYLYSVKMKTVEGRAIVNNGDITVVK